MTKATWSRPAAWLAVGILSLWVRGGFPLHAIGWAEADDALFIRLARSLALGQWLGPYDNLTLAKGPFYPAFITVAALAGIPLKIAEHVTYLIAAACASSYLGRRSGQRHLGTALFVALAFNPVFWDFQLNRVIREGLYISLTLALVTAVVAMSFHRGRLRSRAAIAAGTGLLLGAFWLTREEGPWIIPALACPVGIAIFGIVRQRKRVAVRLRQFGLLAASAGLALLVFTASVQAVMAVNGRYYGEAVTTEFKSASFARAYGALAAIQQDHWERYVVFPHDARLRAYAVSPAARALEPYFEGDGGRYWRRVGCDQTWVPMASCPEILAGWFMWALRDAATATGQAATGRDARRFYDRLADEIDTACGSGALPCLSSHRATLAPPFHWRYLVDVIAPAATLAKIVFTVGGGDLTVPPSLGTPDQLAVFTDLVGPVGPAAPDHAGPVTDERQAAQRYVASCLYQVYRFSAFIAFAAGLVAVGFCSVRRLGFPRPLLGMMAACWAAVFCRIGLLAYLDATSIPSANSLYASPASPFVITGAVLGGYAVLWAWQRRRGLQVPNEPVPLPVVRVETVVAAQPDGPPPREAEAKRSRVAEVWSADQAERAAVAGWYWMAHPFVQQRLNRLASGEPGVDVYRRLGQFLTERGFELPLSHCISLGCGFGALERHLALAGIVDQIDAYDVAEGAIVEARRLALEAGYPGLRYHVADLERFAFPQQQVDIVFAHQSVHHVEDLEGLCEKVRAVLRPGGVFHLHEFVGPTRFQWTDVQLRLVNEFLDSLPDGLRRLPNGQVRPEMVRPTIEAMIAADPSESVRSADIPAVIARYFEIAEHAHLGGALLHIGLSEIAQNFDMSNADHLGRLERLAASEDQAMAAGEVGSDFDVITALNTRKMAG